MQWVESLLVKTLDYLLANNSKKLFLGGDLVKVKAEKNFTSMRQPNKRKMLKMLLIVILLPSEHGLLKPHWMNPGRFKLWQGSQSLTAAQKYLQPSLTLWSHNRDLPFPMLQNLAVWPTGLSLCRIITSLVREEFYCCNNFSRGTSLFLCCQTFPILDCLACHCFIYFNYSVKVTCFKPPSIMPLLSCHSCLSLWVA